MEKPVSVDGPSTRKMLQLAEESVKKNLKVGVGLMCRHCKARWELYDRIKAGQIGELTMLRTYRQQGPAGFTGPRQGNPSELLWQVRNYLGFLWAGGGLFQDVVAHNVDEAVVHFTGDRAHQIGEKDRGALQDAEGDLVTGSDGRPTPVLGVYSQGRKEVFRVVAQDGASTLCCGEHLWRVWTAEDRRRGKPGRVLQTREMVGRLRRAHRHRYELPLLSAPAEFEPRDVPIDPYALGLLLGDGCLTTKTTPSFTTSDPELAAALESSLDGIELHPKGTYDYVLRHVHGHRSGGHDQPQPDQRHRLPRTGPRPERHGR